MLVLAGCGKKSPEPDTAEPAPTNHETAKLATTQAAWTLGAQTLASAHSEARQLRDTIAVFLAEPTADNLETARQQQQKAYGRYRHMAIYIAFAQSNPGLFDTLRQLNTPLDSWPIQPGYLDYFDVYTHSGIVNDIAVPITAEAIRQQHGFSDDTDVSVGYHAIGFLLWGENGHRPVGDYQPVTELSEAQQKAGFSVVDLPNNRRRALLQLLPELLIDDLERFHRQWQFAKSSLHLNYQLLGADARLLLLQNSAVHLLDTVKKTLVVSSHTEENPLHNPFAGTNKGSLIAALQGLNTVLQSGEPSVLSWLVDAPQQQQWHAQVRALESGIAKLEKQPPEQQDKAIEQLQQALTTASYLLQGPKD